MSERGRAATIASRLNVLHLLGSTTDEGGVLAVIRNLQGAPALNHVSHQVVVNEAFVETREPRLSYIRSKHLLADSDRHGRLALGAWKAWFELRKYLQQHSADVIHLHSRGGLLTALLLSSFQNRHIVHTSHVHARRIGLYQFAASQPRFRTIMLTRRMAQHYHVELQRGSVEVVSACFADAYLQRPLAAPLAVTNRAVKVIGIGTIRRWKNWGVLLEALALLPKDVREQVTFDHWGPTFPDADSKAYEQELYARTESLRLRPQVTWHGPTNDVASELQHADLFVLPSNHDPCSLTLMEALAMGIPAVASKSGGNPEIIQEGRTGLLFEMNNPLNLAAKLEMIIRNQVVFDAPQIIRDSVANRSASEVGEEYARIYNEVAEQQARTLKE